MKSGLSASEVLQISFQDCKPIELAGNSFDFSTHEIRLAHSLRFKEKAFISLFYPSFTLFSYITICNQ